jgi:hypothetical protein
MTRTADIARLPTPAVRIARILPAKTVSVRETALASSESLIYV